MDTIRVSGRIADHQITRRNVSYRLDLRTGEEVTTGESAWQSLSDTSGVTLKVEDRYGKRATCEFSVPKMHRVSNRYASDFAEASEAVQAVHGLASDYVDWLDDWAELIVRRIDLVRDFRGVHRPGSILDRLAMQRKRPGQVRNRYVDGPGEGYESLAIRQGNRWRLNVYDKAAELRVAAHRSASSQARAAALLADARGAEAQGQLRVEIQLRNAVLREQVTDARAGSLTTNHERLDTVAENYFKATGLDAVVRGPEALREVLLRMDSTEDRKASDRMMGVLLRDAMGLDQVAHRTTVTTARQLAGKYGLTPADLRLQGSGQARLDWDSSSLMTVAGDAA